MLFDETSEGADYLSGLKKSSSPQAAAAAPAKAPEAPRSAPERAAAVLPPSKMTAPSAGNRRSPRYRCKGSVRLQESGSTTSTWATFADISMHGCYVEATAPMPVGAVLGLQLEVNGFRVEAAGEVRVAYAGLGMGISFNEISAEDRARLRELVRSISPPSVIVSPRVAPHSPAPADALPGVPNPGAALQAILTFFENRHIMGREEFLKILRKSQ